MNLSIEKRELFWFPAVRLSVYVFLCPHCAILTLNFNFSLFLFLLMFCFCFCFLFKKNVLLLLYYCRWKAIKKYLGHLLWDVVGAIFEDKNNRSWKGGRRKLMICGTTFYWVGLIKVNKKLRYNTWRLYSKTLIIISRIE